MLAPITNLFTRGLFGPVFQREVRVAGRRNSTYWVRGLYVLGLTAMAALVYFAITADTRYAGTGRAESLQQLQSFAPTLGAFYVWFQFLTMCLLASTLTAGAICDERRKGSLSALLTTPLSIFQIILGKLSGRLIQLFILVASGLPLLLAARIFGGISTHYIIAALAITLCTSLLHASISLAASANARSSSAASATGVVVGVVWCFFPMLGALIPPVSHSGRSSLLFLSLSPYFALDIETAKSLGLSIGLKGSLSWYFSAGYALVGTVLFLALACYRLKVLARTAGEPFPSRALKKRRGRTESPQQESASSTALVAFEPPLATSPKPDPLTVSDNPVLWRELRQRMFAKPWHPRIGLLGTILLLLYIYSQAGWANPVVLYVFTVILLALFSFQCSVIGSSSVAGERESRSLEVLLTTPLSARDIIYAKWLGALRRLLPIPVFYFSFVLICGVLSGNFHWALLPHLVLIVIPPACFLVATGVWLSVVTRRATVAATVNILIALALWIAIPLIGIAFAAIVQPLLGSRFSSEALALLIYHPGAMTVTALGGAAADIWGGARNSQYQSFLPFSFTTFSLATLGYAVLYFALAWLILRLAARSLGRRTNRAH